MGVVELLRKALEWKALLDSAEATNQAGIARREGIPRARATQVMWCPHAGPPFQDADAAHCCRQSNGRIDSTL